MSESTVRTHRNPSNRAKNHSGHKVVHKGLLDNPFQVSWPVIPPKTQQALLARLLILLGGISAYQRTQRLSVRKAKRQPPPSPIQANETHPDGDLSDTVPHISADKGPAVDVVASIPLTLPFLTIGINAVSKKLEALSRSYRQVLATDVATEKSIDCQMSPQLVFVCQADTEPELLVSHLPPLVAACNAARLASESPCWLIPLPHGAEGTLAKALGIKRVSVLSLDCTAPSFPDMVPLLDVVPILHAPWLEPSTSTKPKSLLPTHVKQLRTTAPLNMKAAKEERASYKLIAKQRRKSLASHGQLPTRKKRLRFSTREKQQDGTPKS